MYNLLLTILLVLSVVIVIAIFMQPTKNQSSNVFDASSGDLFERSKARGFEAVMQRLTGILVFLKGSNPEKPLAGGRISMACPLSSKLALTLPPATKVGCMPVAMMFI